MDSGVGGGKLAGFSAGPGINQGNKVGCGQGLFPIQAPQLFTMYTAASTLNCHCVCACVCTCECALSVQGIVRAVCVSASVCACMHTTGSRKSAGAWLPRASRCLPSHSIYRVLLASLVLRDDEEGE